VYISSNVNKAAMEKVGFVRHSLMHICSTVRQKKTSPESGNVPMVTVMIR